MLLHVIGSYLQIMDIVSYIDVHISMTSGLNFSRRLLPLGSRPGMFKEGVRGKFQRTALTLLL